MTAVLVEFLKYENSTLGVKTEYPADWEIFESSTEFTDIVQFTNPAYESPLIQRFFISIEHFPPDDNNTLQEFVNSTVYDEDNTNVNILQSNETTIAGNEARRVEYDYYNRFERANSAVVIVTILGDKGYVFGYRASPTIYEENLPIAQKMLDSVQIIRTTTRAPSLAEQGYSFAREFGEDEFMGGLTYGITLDPYSKFVYATLGNHNSTLKFDASGTFITKWGSPGSGDGQFNFTSGVAVDSLGNVYVTDSNNHRIQKFDANGTFITKWGSPGSGDGQFNDPVGIAVDRPSLNDVYVTDVGNHRIQKFDANGSFITKWGFPGSGDGQFNDPLGIAVDNSGYVYVVDQNTSRIQKFTSDGQFITKWGSKGSGGDGQLDNPWGIAIDSSDNVYVADLYNARIQKFTSDGQFISKWGSIEQTGLAIGVAVDSSGNVYVLNNGKNVVVFAPVS